MGIVDFLFNLFNKEKDQYKELMDERSKIMEEFKTNYKTKLGFTDLEVKEVLDVFNLAQVEIEEIKRSLANVNMNNPNTEQDVQKAVEEINKISMKMYEDIRLKTAEILKRKKEFKDKQKD